MMLSDSEQDLRQIVSKMAKGSAQLKNPSSLLLHIHAARA